jgi:hypothetical protein
VSRCLQFEIRDGLLYWAWEGQEQNPSNFLSLNDDGFRASAGMIRMDDRREVYVASCRGSIFCVRWEYLGGDDGELRISKVTAG